MTAPECVLSAFSVLGAVVQHMRALNATADVKLVANC